MHINPNRLSKSSSFCLSIGLSALPQSQWQHRSAYLGLLNATFLMLWNVTDTYFYVR